MSDVGAGFIPARCDLRVLSGGDKPLPYNSIKRSAVKFGRIFCRVQQVALYGQ